MVCRPVWKGNGRIGIAEDVRLPTDSCKKCQFMKREDPLPRSPKARIAYNLGIKSGGDSASGWARGRHAARTAAAQKVSERTMKSARADDFPDEFRFSVT